MKTTFFCLLTLTALPLLADKRIQMESKDLARNTTGQQEILIRSNALRVNDGTNSFMYREVNGKGEMVILDKAKNTYQVMDEAMIAQLGQQMAGMNAQLEAAMKGMGQAEREMMAKMMGKMPQAAAPKPVTTVYTRKGAGTINGFACTNYEGMRSGQKASEVCAAAPTVLRLSASDMQVFEKMRQFTSKLMASVQSMAGMMGAQSMAGIGEAGFDGFPVLTRTFANGTASREDSVKSTSDAALTDADFSTGTATRVDLGMPTPGGKR